MREDESWENGDRHHPWSPTAAEAAVFLAAIVLGILIFHRFSPGDPDPLLARRDSLIHRIDITTAPAAELTLLPGIGPHRSRKIVAFRQDAGQSAGPRAILAGAGFSETERESLGPWIRSSGK